MSSDPIIVIGGGPAGMMAAGRAAEIGASVLLLEKMPRVGEKLLITGRTRCNLTNTLDLDSFVEMFGPKGRFLYPAFSRFFRDELQAFMEQEGVPTRMEPDGRIFPLSDTSADVVQAMKRYLVETGVDLHSGTHVTGIRAEKKRVVGVQTDRFFLSANTVVIAAGGASYPQTGSSGDGFRIARALGHTIVPLRPSLVPLAVEEAGRARRLQGVSLSGVRLTSYRCALEGLPSMPPVLADCGRGTGRDAPRGPVIESRTGDMIFTHFGISGPVVLRMSLAIVDALEQGPVTVAVDLFPELSADELDALIRKELDGHGKRTCRHILKSFVGYKMIDAVIELTAIPADTPAHQITAQQRTRLVTALKMFPFSITEPLPLESAMVTAGGVSLDEIDPRTMASRLIQGLFFCGEVMDIDADTGGFNLQAAFSTGFLAGESAAEYARNLAGGASSANLDT